MMPWREAVASAQRAIGNVDDTTEAQIDRLSVAMSAIEPEWANTGAIRWATVRRVYALAVIMACDEGGIDLAGRGHGHSKASELKFLDILCKWRLLLSDGTNREKAQGYLRPTDLLENIITGDFQ